MEKSKARIEHWALQQVVSSNKQPAQIEIIHENIIRELQKNARNWVSTMLVTAILSPIHNSFLFGFCVLTTPKII